MPSTQVVPPSVVYSQLASASRSLTVTSPLLVMPSSATLVSAVSARLGTSGRGGGIDGEREVGRRCTFVARGIGGGDAEDVFAIGRSQSPV
ncbi:hypothetical protein [Cobetia sp. ICG0124]|uniref:hypothetical protein n=1 Tax=Cobetia sp. ICG0124 TaxID=2053669 RepID=UPI000FDC6326|nr:hypothetical protein [Cobetia sp. ICG0124]